MLAKIPNVIQFNFVRTIKSICSNSSVACEHVQVKVLDRVMHIQLQNSSKRNSLHFSMYSILSEALRQAQSSNQIQSVAITGSPGIFCSGNDLSALQTQPFELWPEIGMATIERMDQFIDSLIDLRKPLIAFVDGPAVGIGCSTLGLFDVIYASDRAYFWTPFSKIALVAEGCSSFTFPRLMNAQKAAQMILFNHKLEARQALQWGFVHDVTTSAGQSEDGLPTFDRQKNQLLNQFQQGDLSALGWFGKCKRIARDDETRKLLHEVNRTEGKLLRQAWLSEQHREYLKNFYGKKTS